MRHELTMKAPHGIHVATIVEYHSDMQQRTAWEVVAVEARKSKIFHLYFEGDRFPFDEAVTKLTLIGA